MTEKQKESIITICLSAALADGSKSEEERSKIKEIITNLEIENSSQIFQNVLMNETNFEEISRNLESNELKTFAYEMAVAICDSDGLINPKEREFLDKLKSILLIEQSSASEIEDKAGQLVISKTGDLKVTSPLFPTEDEIDKMIINYAKLNGALELLPQTLATLAIIPLQSKMVYEISQKYGFELDSDHIKEFIATVGIGLTSQTLEGYARKLFGGLAKKVGGGFARSMTSAATGAAISFATTYGLGKIASSYYSGGRKLDMDKLKVMFDEFKNNGLNLFSKYQNEIEKKAENFNLSEIIPMLKK